jgi:hypothetical protein
MSLVGTPPLQGSFATRCAGAALLLLAPVERLRKTLDDVITEYENGLGGLTPRNANMRRIFGSGMGGSKSVSRA